MIAVVRWMDGCLSVCLTSASLPDDEASESSPKMERFWPLLILPACLCVGAWLD